MASSFDHYGTAGYLADMAENKLSVAGGSTIGMETAQLLVAEALVAAKLAEVHVMLGDRATSDGYYSEGAMGLPDYASPIEADRFRNRRHAVRPSTRDEGVSRG